MAHSVMELVLEDHRGFKASKDIKARKGVLAAKPRQVKVLILAGM